MSAISFFATSKRSSCDRCRKQKLRCPTNNDNTKACGRCLRAGVPCVTSYTKPRGRSQKHCMSADGILYESSPDTRAMQETSIPTPESILSISSTSSGPAMEESNAQSWSLFDEHNVCLSLTDFDPGNISQNQDENSEGLWYSSLYKDHDPDNLIDLSGTSQSACPADTPSSLYDGPKAKARSYTAEIQQQMESDMQLSQLNLELCRQLKTHLLGPATTSESSVQNPCSGISDALGGVLQTTEAYIHILQHLGNCAELHPDRTSTTCPPTLSFLCVLNLTSCFFRIVDLFNILLSNLALELLTHSLSPSPSCSSSAAAMSTLQILPELNLAGLPVHEVSLQIKILVLAITHHFETMERLLGLPAELRVSECGNDNIYGLLSASWTDMLSAGKRERCELGWGGTGNWVRSVESLRSNTGGLTRVC